MANCNEEQYCMYLRKSRKDDESGFRDESIEETLARHQKILEELAEKRNVTVSEDAIYREVVSGDTIDARPQMQQLLKDVEKSKWRGVLVVEVERLARGDTSDQGRVAKAFKYSETLIITPNKTFDPTNEADEDYFEFGLFMSRRELMAISRRLKNGRLAAVKEGLYVGSKPPYGYERVKLELEKGWTLKPVPEEAKVINHIFKLYTKGEVQADGTNKRIGVSLIVKRLRQLNIPTRTGGDWVESSVRDILINPVYIGKVRWNWRPANKKMIDGEINITRPRAKDDKLTVVDGRHEGIIDPDMFTMAQELMKQNPPRPVGERGIVKNPLSGLVICGLCGRRMVRRPYNKTGYPDTIMCAVSKCPNVSVSLKTAEEKILASVKDWLAGYKLKWNVKDKSKKTTNPALEIARQSLIKLDADIAKLIKQQSNLDDLVEQGVYTIEKYKQRTQELEKRIQLAEDNRKDLLAAITIEEQREEAHRIIIPKVENLLETYYTLPTPQAKNDLLKEVLEKAVYTKKRGGRWHNSPDDFELVLYPKLPRSNP